MSRPVARKLTVDPRFPVIGDPCRPVAQRAELRCGLPDAGTAWKQFQDKLRFIDQTRFSDQDKERLSIILMDDYYESIVQESPQ